MKKSNIVKLILTAFVFGASNFANAQDKATLDILVSKGIITQDEAGKILKSSSIQVKAKEKETVKLTFSGRIHEQFMWIKSEADDPFYKDTSTKSGFRMRRMYLGMAAELANGWSGNLVLDLAKTTNNGANYLDSVTISKKIDWEFLNGKLDVGYRKVNFVFEENTSSSKLLSIERSPATRYFVEGQSSGTKGNIGFGNRYTGVFWEGKADAVKGLSYSFAVTNPQNYAIKPNNSGTDNTVNLWASINYKNDADTSIGKLKYEIGLNAGYGMGANITTDGYSDNGYIVGANPYFKLTLDNFTLWGEYMMANIQYGKKDATGNFQDATPQGVNVGAEYKFDCGFIGQIAPTVRYSGLFTDGRGAKISDTINSAANVSSGGSDYYKNANSIFAGINWYIDGNSVKLQAGYEYARFSGSPSNESFASKSANVNAFRTQLQILF